MKIINLFRFTLFVLSVVFSVNVAFAQSISAPSISATGDGCNTVSFKVESYDASLYDYSVDLNGTSVSLASDGSYSVDSPARDVEYTFSVSRTEISTGLSSEIASKSAKLPKAVETPVIQASAAACDAPVEFSIVSGYNTSLDYTWIVNGVSFPSSTSSYSVSSPVDGATYEATVSVTDNCTSAVSNTVSQSYVKTPSMPQISVSHDCGEHIVFKLDNKSDYPVYYDQVWKINGTTVTPTNGEYKLSSFSDGDSFTLKITVTNTVNGVSCNSVTAEKTVVAKTTPNSPTTHSYKGCADPEAEPGRWEDLVDKKDSYTLVWYDAAIGSDPIPTASNFTFSKSEATPTKTYWVAQENPATGCRSGRSEVSVTVYDVPEAIVVESQITACKGESIVLSAETSERNVTYQWSPINKLVNPTNAYSVTTQPLSSPTQFTLNVSNSEYSACFTTAIVDVNVLSKPEIALDESSVSVCKNGSVTVTNNKANLTKEEYFWETITSGVSSGFLGDEESYTLSPVNKSTTIKLTASLKDLPSCNSEATVSVTMVEPPVADAGADKYVCYGSTVQIGVSQGSVAGVEYEWTNPSDLESPFSPTTMLKPVTKDEKYTLTATSTMVENCKSQDEVYVYKVDKPTIYNVTGNGTYCEGTSPTNMVIKLSGSESGTEYQLVKDGNVLNLPWKTGVNGPLTWAGDVASGFDITAGVYTVIARKTSLTGCEETMSGSAVITSVPSPSASFQITQGAACPGEEISIRVTITGGVAPYKFKLLENGTPKEIEITSGNTYDFNYTPNSATTFQISEVSDAVCERKYAPEDYPTLPLDMANLADFEIKSSKGNKAVCFGENVTLYVDYNDPDAKFEWSNLATTNSISVDAVRDELVKLTITTPQGCVIDREYTLNVIEKEDISITGLNKSATDKDGNVYYYFCSSDANAPLAGSIGMGKFTSEPAGLFQENTLVPSAVTETTKYNVTFSYQTEGCVLDTTFTVYVSAINKEVDWTVAPAFERPWSQTEFEYCQPDPASPKTTIPLQGHPQVAAGTWRIVGSSSLNGGTAPSGASINPTTGVATAQTQLKNVVAGNKYIIEYSVVDEFGCKGVSAKTIKVNSKPTAYFESGGISFDPGQEMCIKSKEATIYANNQIGNFTLSSSDSRMIIPEKSAPGKLVINPSAGKLGSHSVIWRIEHEGCSYSEKSSFTITTPIRINSFNISKEYCQESDPEVITISAAKPTTGDIVILDSNGGVALSRTPITSSPVFDPSEKEGKYYIEYHYNDGTCEDVHIDSVVVHPTPNVDLRMKDDYCFGEKVVILPNYPGGEYSSDNPLEAGTLINNVFDTNKSGLGIFKINYKVKNEFGCVGEASQEFQVRGKTNMNIHVDEFFCQPRGEYDVVGFPKPTETQKDQAYFSTNNAIGLTDFGGGIAKINLENATYDITYPITYHYKEFYNDKDGNEHSCVSSVTKNFTVLNQAADFAGYNHNQTICADVVKLELTANLPAHTTFEFEQATEFPTAFVDNGDGSATLFPSQLQEGKYYTVSMLHQYYDETGKLVCESEIKKSFYISEIEEVQDISLYCHADNRTSVKLENTELGVRYDLWVDGGVYDTYLTDTPNETVEFKAIEIFDKDGIPVYVVAVDPHETSCTRKMSKEFTLYEFAISGQSTDITCGGEGLTNGTFIGSAKGGVPVYSHELIDTEAGTVVLQAESSITLPKGKYEYKVTDAIGCTRTFPFEIKEPNKLELIVEQEDVRCNGDTTASVKANVVSNSGTSPYIYTWTKRVEDGDLLITNESTMKVGKGHYHIKVEDANGCYAEKTIDVLAPEKPLTVVLEDKVDVQIRGNATGEIYIKASGGTPDENNEYTYEWTGLGINDANRNLEDLQGLVAGTYTVTVKDSRGCEASLSVFVYEPTPIEVLPTVNNPKCFGDTDGVISLTIAGGSTPYNISWLDETGNIMTDETGAPLSSREIAGLSAGKYQYIIIDKDGNKVEDEVIVKENPQLVVTTSLLSELNNKCYGDENGKIVLTIDGGTGIYTVDWGSIPAEKIIAGEYKAINLGYNTYNIDVKDSNGCEVSHAVEVTQPAEKLQLEKVDIVQNICHNAKKGAIDITMKGGTPNYTYSWEGVGVNPTAEDQIGLTAGESYSVKVTDANNCQWTSEVFVMENPQELTLSLEKTDITCKGSSNGSIKAIVTGEAQFDYVWEDSHSNILATGNRPKLDGLDVEMYTVTVTDKNGCNITGGIQITEPEELTATVKLNNITCHDADNASVHVIAEGGTGEYTYALSEVGASTIISTENEYAGLSDGVYEYKVMDENECLWTSEPIKVINPEPITISFNVSHVTIFDEANGLIDLDITGGTPGMSGYKIEWLRGTSVVTDPTDPAYNADQDILSNIKAGLYKVLVTDENGCAAVAEVEVTQPEVITVDIEVTDVRCNGKKTGIINVKTTEGGDGNYKYTLLDSDGNVISEEAITGSLAAGIYTLNITDGAGAPFSREVVVSQPDSIQIVTVPELSKLSVDCFGNATGAVKVNISGGVPDYDYRWIGSSAVASAVNTDYVEGLSAGTYMIELTDANNCYKEYEVEIKGPAQELRVTETIVQNVCYGETNAYIDVEVSGGTGEYRYLWTGAGLAQDKINDQDQYNLYSGQVYTLTVRDELGCTEERNYKIDERYEIKVSTSVKDVLCYGEETGELHAEVEGGTPLIPGQTAYLTSKWESKDGSYSVTALDVTNKKAGEYIFTVKDDIGCVITKEVEIAQPDKLIAKIEGDDVLCGGVDNGHLEVKVTGGTENYSYKWYKDYDYTQEIGVGAHLTNLGAGDYEVFIEDRNSCPASAKKGIVSSIPMSIDTIVTHILVNGANTGVIEINVSGGTPPLTATWASQSKDLSSETGFIVDELPAGYYEVTVIDGFGCKLTERIEVKQPQEINVIREQKDIKCFGEKGNIILTVSGGMRPYKYDWTGPNGFTYSGTGPEFSEISNLEPGVYDVIVTDAAGLQVPKKYEIKDVPQLTWVQHDSKVELDCHNDNDGYINIEVAGGTLPYTIIWNGPGLDKENVYSVGNLTVGKYTAEITDANDCPIDRPFIQEITQPEELKLDATLTHNNCYNDKEGAIDISVTGGTPDYIYRWSGFDVDQTAEDQINLPRGEYNLHLEDANRCTIDTLFTINAKNETFAAISGPSNICSGEEFQIQIDVNGLAPWTIEYTDGSQIYTETTEENSNVYTHSLLADAEFKLVKVVDANGCEAKLGENLQIDVHEVPQITIVSAQEDCCLGEPALIDIIFAGKGPWTINYTDGTLDYVDGPFISGRDFLKIIPKQVGTQTYTIKSVSNDNCTVDVNYSVDITAYTYPNLEVDINPSVCQPNPLKVYLHATGEAPWHVVYYLNELKYEHDMMQEEEVLDIYPNQEDNLFIFESIKSGKRCVSKLGKEIQAKMDLLPKDATAILGSNMVCRNSTTTFTTPEIPYATSYVWSLPSGFNIVSGLGSNTIVVEVNNVAVSGEVSVWGSNKCGEGVKTSIEVEVDKPMTINGAQITIPPYVCDDNTIFPLSVSEVEGATNYEWVMPVGYNVLSGQGTRSVMVQIDKYALSNTISVVPSNVCTSTEPIEAYIILRDLPKVDAGVDFTTKNCSTVAQLSANLNPDAISSQWRLVRGNAVFEDDAVHNTNVSELMYGENVLSWNVNDGFCVAYDTVKVTNWNPGITEPEFSEITICEDYMTLRAGVPKFGEGQWILRQGDGEFENPNSPETLITGLSNKRTNVIRWEVYSSEDPRCRNSIDVQVISHSLNSLVDAGADGVSTTGTYRLSARLVNDSNIKGTWTIEGGSGTIEDPHNPNTIVTGLATGINTIRWTISGYDCEAYDEIRVRLVDEPIASFNIENAEGCEPLTVQFTNTTVGDAEYKWEFGDGSTSDLRSPEHIFEKAGTYTVKLTATGDGRADSFTGVVNVLPSPVAEFSVAERQLYVPNAEAHFYNETENAVKYFWQFGDGSTSEKENPVYTYIEDGDYDITYIVSDINLCSDTLVMEKYIRVGKDSYLVFPTAFTPNVERSNGGVYSEGERRLDVFYPIGRNVDTYKLEIFSSWGVKVFESNDKNIGWDGYYLGQCADQGIYFYKAEGRFKDGNAFQYSGNLMLIR